MVTSLSLSIYSFVSHVKECGWFGEVKSSNDRKELKEIQSENQQSEEIQQ